MNIDDTADKLENAVKEIRTFLLAELGYVEEIQDQLSDDGVAAIVKDGSVTYDYLKDKCENDVDDNIDYLVRDLDPEYKNQHGAIDTLVEKLREVQEFRKEHLKGIEA
jgi:hypothetical protein